MCLSRRPHQRSGVSYRQRRIARTGSLTHSSVAKLAQGCAFHTWFLYFRRIAGTFPGTATHSTCLSTRLSWSDENENNIWNPVLRLCCHFQGRSATRGFHVQQENWEAWLCHAASPVTTFCDKSHQLIGPARSSYFAHHWPSWSSTIALHGHGTLVAWSCGQVPSSVVFRH